MTKRKERLLTHEERSAVSKRAWELKRERYGPQGRSYDGRRSTDTFDQYINHLDNGCWEWTGSINHDGYGRYRSRPAHRESYKRYVGPIPPGLCVCHHCDNPACVNPNHLWLGTNAENSRDMKLKGRARGDGKDRAGAGNPNAKLTEQAVRDIRDSGAPKAELAQRYGVSQSTIADVIARRKWSHVP